MSTTYCRLTKPTMSAAAALIGLLAASCAPQYSPPQQVAATNPSVTYKYMGDQELLQAEQQATDFCNQYRAAPRTRAFTNDPDGSKVVIFDCVQTTAQVVPTQQFNPNFAYSYQTDSELLEGSKNAQTYCMNSSSQAAVSSITTNPNGTRTVAFRCGRP